MKTQRKIDLLSQSEVLAILRACGRSRSGRRHRAMITLWWRAGLRLAESLAVQASDIHVAPDEVYVRRGKGGRPRKVPLDADAMEVLQAWIFERGRIAGWSSNLLLGSISRPVPGRPLDPPGVRRSLSTIAARAGLASRRVHPHAFRHLYAVELHRERVEIAKISKLLGHRSIATTAIYLDHVSGVDLAEAIAARDPWFDPEL